MVLQAEGDVLNAFRARQEDNALLRLWEAAGTSHADLYTARLGIVDTGNDPNVAQVQEVASPVPGVIDCQEPVNSGPHHFIAKAAIAALNAWVSDGTLPPVAPLLSVDDSQQPARLNTDAQGNAVGGIRTPHVDVPTARLSGVDQPPGGLCFLFGTTTLFDTETLMALYPDQTSYLQPLDTAADAAVAAGFILQADVDLIKQAARNSQVGVY